MKKGFSVIELMIVMAICVIIGIVALVNLQGGKNNNDLTSTTKQIGALLREAQSDSMAQEQGATWGVYFSNATNTAPFYALYINAYATTTRQGYYRVPGSVGYSASFLASGTTTSITFAQISGAASASTTIQLYSVSQPSLTAVVTVASSGAVSD